ncbi:MAG TPA: sulfurtransferase [Acidimicrobiia bacterium]|nr:sulfurtransferase [Acidimicrobiia bacterium]
MSKLENDPTSALQAYAHPNMLVTADWLQEHLGAPGLVVVESDEDVLLYETGHIPGAVKVDWHTELNDQVARDYLDGEKFARLMSEKGISRDDTVVFYGDNFNWWAAYALWVFSLFDHPDVRLLDGGRQKWVADGRPTDTEVPSRPRADYPVVDRDDTKIRAYKDQVMDHVRVKKPLVDVRSPEEYSGEKTHMPEYPQEGVLRGGHIPGAASVPWKKAANEDGTFKSVDDLKKIYAEEQGLRPDDDIVAYCRIGERSSHTWFVLTHLLGYPQVRNYDGSWTEWGNAVRSPIERPGMPVTPPV